ncbi:MAG: co-chaperone YbbN [Alphaproteobacteria bacterium]|nr:co-chaperone YbbN [Alphaproteobacteria bacterium]
MVDGLIGMNSGGKRVAPAAGAAGVTSAATAAHPVLDVETKDFVVQVLDGSMAVPVIVDFWAPWCGPCKTLGPIIEKVVAETRGQVRLVKVDIDKNQELAGQMRIQSIPAVYGFFGGRPVDGFVGALPESQVRSFVQRLLATVKAAGGGASNPLEQAMEQAMELQTAGDFEGALALYEAILQHEPQHPGALIESGRILVAHGQLEAAKACLARLPTGEVLLPGQNQPTEPLPPGYQAALTALKTSIELVEQAGSASEAAKQTARLTAQLAADPKDLAARFDLALAHYATGNREAAIDELMEILRRDRKWREEAAKTQLLKIFDAIGADDPLTLASRRKMSAVLFS